MLHDDCAPEPGCLATLLTAADASPSAGVLGPLALDWDDPRLVVEAGLSTDASGHRQTGIGPSELDWSRLGRGHGTSRAPRCSPCPRPGMLVRRELWERLGGFDPAIPLLREDIDFGWRANRAGRSCCACPPRGMRHVRAVPAGCAASTRHGAAAAARGRPGAGAADLPGQLLDAVVRARRAPAGRALPAARARLRHAAPARREPRRARRARLPARRRRRAARRPGRSGGAAVEVRSVRGLFTSTADPAAQRAAGRGRAPGAPPAPGRRRARPAARTGEPRRHLVRRRPGNPSPRAGRSARRRCPPGVDGRPRRPAGLRRPPAAVAVALPLPDTGCRTGCGPRPARVPRRCRATGRRAAQPDLVIVEVDRARLARQVLLVAAGRCSCVALLGLGAVAQRRPARPRPRRRPAAAGRPASPRPGRPTSPPGTRWPAARPRPPRPRSRSSAGSARCSRARRRARGGGRAAVRRPAARRARRVRGHPPACRWTAGCARSSRPRTRCCRPRPPRSRRAGWTWSSRTSCCRRSSPGIIALLGRARTDSTRWLSIAAASAFGLAVLGAFSPLVHLLLVVYALAGFVLVPGRRGYRRRRVTALFMVVLMPLALLLPWPAVLIQHPGVVVHGVGAQVGTVDVTLVELAGARPGRAGRVAVRRAGGRVAALVGARGAAAAAAAARARAGGARRARRVAGAGGAAVPLTGGPAQPGWAGPGLLLAGWGLLLALLGACRTGRGERRSPGTAPARGSRPGSGWPVSRARGGRGARRAGRAAGRRARAAARDDAVP